MLNDKDEALYVKACVIPANEEDSQGDTLSSEDIKRILKFRKWILKSSTN